jgi:hypothetical protein
LEVQEEKRIVGMGKRKWGGGRIRTEIRAERVRRRDEKDAKEKDKEEI